MSSIISGVTKPSQSIFILEDNNSIILSDYIDLCFFDSNTYKTYKESFITSLFNCLCCSSGNSYETVIPFSPKDMFFGDKITKWVYDLSLSYIRMSGIDCEKLRLYSIECVRSSEKIVIDNNKAATVVFHFNNNHKGYVTTHKNKINYLTDDQKYIIAIFERTI